MGMPLKAFEVPKYAQIVTTIQERIADGTYGPGVMIPSETVLMAEFDTSRPTVVRALGILQQDGWLDAEHGRGRFVRRSHGEATTNGGAGRAVLGAESKATVRVLSVGEVPAPIRVASTLGVEEGFPVWARRRLITSPAGPVQLTTVYTAVELATDTDLAGAAFMRGDVTTHLAARKGVRFDYATDRIGARLSTAEETRVLDMGRRDAVLTVLVTAYDTTGTARVVADAVMPAVRMELEDSFTLR
jgi:GntR family transcriptional regulator